MDFFSQLNFILMPEGIKRRWGKNVLAIDLLFLMVITICASLLQYGAEPSFEL